MSFRRYLSQFVDNAETGEKIKAAQKLAPYLHEPQVMDVLCEAAMKTTSHRFRNTLLNLLLHRPGDAKRRFSNAVLWSKCRIERKWALVNLKLMGCNDAGSAVVSGLYDPDTSVREAAELNICLYSDKDLQTVFDHYFETHCSDENIASLSMNNDPMTSNRTVFADDTRSIRTSTV